MRPTDFQFLYIVLILPCLFGLTLIGEGLVGIYQEKYRGWVSIFFGFIFIGIALLAYFYFSTYLA